MRAEFNGVGVEGTPPRRHAEPDLLRRQDVARILDVSPSTLYRWVTEGRFPDYDLKEGTRYRRWRRATVQKWMAAVEAEKERLEKVARLARERRAARRKGCL
jgi:excisionase family DNA binding protein